MPSLPKKTLVYLTAVNVIACLQLKFKTMLCEKTERPRTYLTTPLSLILYLHLLWFNKLIVTSRSLHAFQTQMLDKHTSRKKTT